MGTRNCSYYGENPSEEEVNYDSVTLVGSTVKSTDGYWQFNTPEPQH